jgi:purine nucleosidase
MKSAFFFVVAMVLGLPLQSAEPNREPVIFDTDIGTDIDDAYALAALIHRPELELLGVTTVSSDAVARARLAAKLLRVAGGPWADVPVYAGISTPAQYMTQVEWARDFHSPALHDSGGVEFMRREILARPGKVTLIAVGELTNVAALLESEPGIGRKIRAIALMGGAVYRGHAPGSRPEPEWNIRSNAKAARVVFESGVPLLVAPLDSTADLKLTPEMRARIFLRGTPLNDALASLDQIWRNTNHWKGDLPTLFDVLPVELVNPRRDYPLEALHLEIADDGLMRAVKGRKPNARVSLAVDVQAFMENFIAQLAREAPRLKRRRTLSGCAACSAHCVSPGRSNTITSAPSPESSSSSLESVSFSASPVPSSAPFARILPRATWT